MNYFDPTEILVEGNYDIEGGIILLAAAAVLVVASQWRFTRMDIQ
jgi:ABC-2 type transport system permease protein